MKIPLLIPLACLMTAATSVAQMPSWSQMSPAVSPAARQNHAMVYDSNRGVCVMFGAWDGTARRNDTWEWDGTAWTENVTPNAPTVRDGMIMAFDSKRNVTVCTSGYVNPMETWEYDGTDWTQINTVTNAPGFGPHNPMTYDSDRGVCVHFGRKNSLPETWEYDGVDWKQLMPATSPTSGTALAYDTLRKKSVMFNGSGETWEWDGTDWTQIITATTPPGRGAAAGMVYDSDRQLIVMFGGSGGLTDTWEYDGSDWRQIVAVSGPGARNYLAMAYDSARHRTVLFGGRLPTGLVGDTWEYASSDCFLTVDTPSISIVNGGSQNMVLDAGPSNAARLYTIFGSMTGTSPGLPFNGAHIFLNPDPYTELVFTNLNSAFFVNFNGVLDGAGQAKATFFVPPGIVPSGFTVHHAFVTYISAARNYCASNSARAELK